MILAKTYVRDENFNQRETRTVLFSVYLYWTSDRKQSGLSAKNTLNAANSKINH